MPEIADGPNIRAEHIPAGGVTPATSPANTPGPRRSIIRLAVAGTALFTLAIVAFLGWRWAQVPSFPDMTVDIRGDASTADAEVVIKCEDEQREIARTKLNPAENYEFRVMIDRRKRHSLRATYGTQVVFDTTIDSPTSGNIRYNIHIPPDVKAAAITPATKPANGEQPP